MIDDQEKARRNKIKILADYGVDLPKAISVLKQFENEQMNSLSITWEQHLALIKVFEHFEEIEKHQQEPQQVVQVKKVLEFADCLDEYAQKIREKAGSSPTILLDVQSFVADTENFAQSLRNYVCPDRKQEYKATMYVWNGGGSTALYDDDKRVWLGGLLTIADAMRAFGWDFERIEIDRDDLCGKAPPMSLKEMQELLAGVERQKKRERLAELREELADLEKELEGNK